MTTLDVALVAEGLKFPEGPVALGDGSVALTEIEGKRVARVAANGAVETIAETGGGPNGLAIGPDGALYVTNNGGSFQFTEVGGVNYSGLTKPEHRGGSIQRIDLDTGALTTLYTHCGERKLLAPNDLVFDRQGGFWFTDYGLDYKTHKVYGALYYAKTDGSFIACPRERITSPNGIGLSADEKTLYVADTLLSRLWAMDIVAPGALAAPMMPLVPGRVVAALPGVQPLDSLAVAASGKVCVGTILNGGVTVFSPDGTFEHFSLPDPVVTNICFGGPDMRDAWITASGTGRLYKARWPEPGLRLNFQQ